MTGQGLQITPRTAYRAVLAVGLLVILAVNLPGHLSYDSVAQLYEGHFHVRETWGPALYAWILGFFDHFVPGTALYVTTSAVLFFGGLASFSRLRGRTGWLAAPMAALALATPQLLIYQGIVWKDVAFANTAIAGLICVAHAARLWPQAVKRWLLLGAALGLMAVASQVRQNGIIAAGVGAVGLGWIAAGQMASAGWLAKWRTGFLWGVSGFVAVAALGHFMTVASIPPHAPKDPGMKTGLRIVQNYDLVAAAALDRTYKLDILAAVDPIDAALIVKRAPLEYSGRRVDFIDRDQPLTDALGRVSDAAAMKQWVDLITRHPGLYLRARMEDFRWLVAPPVIDWCLPVYTGVDAPIEKMAPLKLAHRYVQSDIELNNYSSWFLDTPVYSHLFYAAVSLVLAGLFLWRRQPADIMLAAMQLAGVAHLASFFIITIACDYRYLYFTDLAALVGLIYAAVDPPWRRSAGPSVRAS